MPDERPADERAADTLTEMRDDELTRLLDDVHRIAAGIDGMQELAVRAFAPVSGRAARPKSAQCARTIAELRERLKAARASNGALVPLPVQTVVAVLVLLADVEPVP